MGWATVNVEATGNRVGDWWEMATPRGQAKTRIRDQEGYGILDHDFGSPEAAWTLVDCPGGPRDEWRGLRIHQQRLVGKNHALSFEVRLPRNE